MTNKSIMNYGICCPGAKMTIVKVYDTLIFVIFSRLSPFKNSMDPNMPSMSLLLCGGGHGLTTNFPHSIFEFLQTPYVGQLLTKKCQRKCIQDLDFIIQIFILLFYFLHNLALLRASKYIYGPPIVKYELLVVWEGGLC